MSKRRSNGEGNLRLRADGRWEMTFMEGYRDNGRRKTKSFFGKSQKEVKAKAKAYFDAKAAGLATEKVYHFVEWADLWFEHHKDNISLTTQEGYSYTLRILKEYFGQRNIADIKPYDIELFLKKLRQDGKSDSGIAKCRSMLYQMLGKAEANDLIRKNPVRCAEHMRRNGVTEPKDCFTAEEVRALMKYLPEDRKIGFGIRLLLGTGMRVQELLALEPKHIEPDGSCIHIRQAINMVKGKPVVGVPKSRDSCRDIPVPKSLRKYAVKLRKTPYKYVFGGGNIELCNPSTFRKYYKAIVGDVPGVRVLPPHACRHTYVSQLQALGVDLATIQSLVGHADVDMTRHYLHVQEPVRQDAIARFSEAFGDAENL